MNDYAGGTGGWLSRALSFIGFGLIATASILQFGRGELAVWALACCLVAGVAWMLLVVVRMRGPVVSLPLVAVMVAGGAIAGTETGGSSLVIAAIGVLWLTRDLRRSVLWGAVLGVAAMAILLVGGLLHPIAALGMLSMQAGVVVAFLGGESRRQFLRADIRTRELLEEQSRTDVLAARQQLAHDIHDVLAHSLGGLVIQLDAVDALLDAGDTASAAARVRDARALAAEGLGEARRAVAALGESVPDRGIAGEIVASDVAALIAVHRSLGGRARLVETGTPAEVSGALAVALRRAVQEGLTNARKHAQFEPVTVTMDWTADGVSIEIVNPLGAPGDESGGGHGLVGMRERFAALPGGAVSSGVADGQFIVTAHAGILRTATA